jgi:hypothetical protein
VSSATTVGEARAVYYAANGFGDDGGESLRWVPIRIFGITMWIPNSDARRRAVKIHDVHHVLTGFQTDLRGEGEIAAWELASGCLRVPVAFVLDAFALGFGLAISPARMARAWALGRATRNLYDRGSIDHLLTRPVSEVRDALGLSRPPPAAGLRDALAVAALGVPALAIVVSPLLALALLL